MKNISQKVQIIDKKTFDDISKSKPHEEKKIKNVKHKKSNKSFTLSDFIKLKTKQKIRSKMCLKIYKNCMRNRRKKKTHSSKLKKNILKCRLLKKVSIAENQAPTTIANETDIVTLCLENLTLEPNSQKSHVHSRRFREYCDNTTSRELCVSIEMLLRDLSKFQKRSFQRNEYKGRSHRRFVCGFREVQNLMNINKLKLIIIATDCESCAGEDGLDNLILGLKESCKENGISYVFAFNRRQLAYILFKKGLVSVIGILDYNGAQEIYFKILNLIELEKYNYKCITAV